ncbi:hypothetical protein V8G54_014941 [Vigna mungo]|uniref:Uncharacterized protein n=1 Tax=Vigna mungo TaxID=3915 RepID=A0AAQ3RZQ4_VIGMU
MRNVSSHTKIIVHKLCGLQMLLSLWITNCYLPPVKNSNSSMFYLMQKCTKAPLLLHWTHATSPGQNSSKIISCTSRKNSNWRRGNKILLVYRIQNPTNSTISPTYKNSEVRHLSEQIQSHFWPLC